MNLWNIGFDSVGVALKGGVTGDKVPVVFHGVLKMVGHVTMDAGSIVGNSQTVGTTITYGNVCVATTINTANSAEIENRRLLNGTGTAWTLGMALQATAAAGDEILVLVGGSR